MKIKTLGDKQKIKLKYQLLNLQRSKQTENWNAKYGEILLKSKDSIQVQGGLHFDGNA